MSAADFIPFTDLAKKLQSYGKTEHDILSLGIRDDLKFFVALDRVIIRWNAVLDAAVSPADRSQMIDIAEQREPLGSIDVSEPTFFQISPGCLERLMAIAHPTDAQLECPQELRSEFYEKNFGGKFHYETIFYPLGHFDAGWVDPDWENDPELLSKSKVGWSQLWVSREDARRMESAETQKDSRPAIPKDWLRRKMWSVQQALMLFTGLNPYKHGIEVGSDGVLVHLKHVEKLGYELCPSTYALMSRAQLQQMSDSVRADAEKRLAEAYKAPVQLPVEMLTIKEWIDNDALSACKKWLKFYDDSEKLLGSFLQAWLENREEALDHQLPPSTFFRWVAEKGLIDKIPWWEEAVEKGFKNQFMETTAPASPLSSEDSLKERVEKFLLPVVQGRLESERIKLEDLSHALQEEIKKLVAIIAEENPGAVHHILLIGDASNKQLKTFLAATKAVLEIVGHSRLVDKSTSAGDLIAQFRKAAFSKPTTYGADSRRHRHLVILQLEAFPFTEGDNSSGFDDIQSVVRLVATTSPTSPTPLPREIQKLFKIKVDFGTSSEVQAENGGEVSAVELTRNYFRSTGGHWEFVFNGKKGTVDKLKPFLFLLKYLGRPNVFLPSEQIFREVQSDLGEGMQRDQREGCEDDEIETALNEEDEDEISDVAKKDRTSFQKIVPATALNRDETSVLTPKQKQRFEEALKQRIVGITSLTGTLENDEREEKKRELQNVIETLKREYGATVDPQTGKIISYNSVAKGRNQAAEETRRNLRRSVKYLSKRQKGPHVDLAEHIQKYLIEDIEIYQPPKDFPKWDIRY